MEGKHTPASEILLGVYAFHDITDPPTGLLICIFTDFSNCYTKTFWVYVCECLCTWVCLCFEYVCLFMNMHDLRGKRKKDKEAKETFILKHAHTVNESNYKANELLSNQKSPKYVRGDNVTKIIWSGKFRTIFTYLQVARFHVSRNKVSSTP